MKLYIKTNDGVNLKLWLPTSFLKTKFISNMINKNDDLTDNNIDKLPEYYDILRKYIKEHGHFTLVEVISANGEEIKIYV